MNEVSINTSGERYSTSADQQIYSTAIANPILFKPGIALVRNLLNHPSTSNSTIRALCPNLEDTVMKYWEVAIMPDNQDIHAINTRIDTRFDELSRRMTEEFRAVNSSIGNLRTMLTSIKKDTDHLIETKVRWKPSLASIFSLLTLALLIYKTFFEPAAELPTP